ncbi:hypothetical protein IC232_04285 [Microvirga sp. BT688]|uniref:hypothetical protein n=1 Tax=Microvirga sp. TaxID=1873136 RepID=UPI001681E136|nr:hypothetical protein [Microvirga sp.]MBD2745912.1 hypothetical protein [Microvirga sp.]
MNQNGHSTIQVLASSLNPQTFLPAQRRGDLIHLAQSFPANAVRHAIRATAAAVRGRHTDEDFIDPNVFVPNERQIELMAMAQQDSASAVDQAICETAAFHLLKTRTAH